MAGMSFMLLGPVAEAAQGGHSSPLFDLLVGLSVLAATWFGYAKRRAKISIWPMLGITAICLVFIIPAIWNLLRR
jgi:hypothetical protein